MSIGILSSCALHSKNLFALMVAIKEKYEAHQEVEKVYHITDQS